MICRWCSGLDIFEMEHAIEELQQMKKSIGQQQLEDRLATAIAQLEGAKVKIKELQKELRELKNESKV